MKHLQLTDILCPGIYMIMFAQCTSFSITNLYDALIFIGLTRERGIALFNHAVIDLTRIRNDLDERNFITLPDSVYHPRLEVIFETQS